MHFCFRYFSIHIGLKLVNEAFKIILPLEMGCQENKVWSLTVIQQFEKNELDTSTRGFGRKNTYKLVKISDKEWLIKHVI